VARLILRPPWRWDQEGRTRYYSMQAIVARIKPRVFEAVDARRGVETDRHPILPANLTRRTGFGAGPSRARRCVPEASHLLLLFTCSPAVLPSCVATTVRNSTRYPL
jgi:hypothetical protein